MATSPRVNIFSIFRIWLFFIFLLSITFLGAAFSIKSSIESTEYSLMRNELDTITHSQFSVLKSRHFRLLTENLGRNFKDYKIKIIDSNNNIIFNFNESINSNQICSIRNISTVSIDLKSIELCRKSRFSSIYFLSAFVIFLTLSSIALIWIKKEENKTRDQLIRFFNSNGVAIPESSPYASILSEIEFLISRFKTLKATETRLKVSEARSDIANQVIHDVRSPISALKSIMNHLNGELEVQSLLEHVIKRIQSICYSLEAISREDSTNEPECSRDFCINSMVEFAIQEKIIENPMLEGQIVLNTEIENSKNASKIDGISFSRILSNIINNSIEATDNIGRKIFIKINSEIRDQVTIQVVDNGKGIPKTAIGNVFRKGFTEGKSRSFGPAGSGLGLFHAKESLRKIGGLIHITSKVGIGTTVTMKFPAAPS